MATLYNDFMMRSNLGDQGEVPAAGALSASPDIIPYGNQSVADPGTTFGDFSKDMGSNVLVNQNNFVWVRGENLAQGPVAAQVRLFYSKATLLSWPNQWLPNQLKTSQNEDHVTLQVQSYGEKSIAKSPFVWNAQPIEGSNHYCMIGEVITPTHPDNIPKMSSVGDFAAWVQTNRNISWRNVQLVDSGAPDFQNGVYYDQGAATEEVHFILTLKGIPDQCEVAFNCPSNPDINLPRTRVQGQKDIGIYANIAAGFKDTIYYSFWSNGQQVQPAASIQLRAIYIPPANTMLARVSSPARLLGVPHKLVQHRQKEFSTLGLGPVTAVVLGSHQALYK